MSLSLTDTPAGDALDAFGADASLGPGLVCRDGAIVFPAHAAWLSLRVDLAPGWHRLAFRCSAPMLHVELNTANGFVPLPMDSDPGRGLVCEFGLKAPVAELRLLPSTAGPVRFTGFACDPVTAPNCLLPLWEVADVHFAPSARAMDAHAVRAAPAPLPGWDRPIVFEAVDGVAVDGARLFCSQAPAMSLRFEPPLARGRYTIEGTFRDENGAPALVSPQLFAHGAAANEPHMARLRQVSGPVYRAMFSVAEATDRLIFQPREERGSVTVEALRIETMRPARAASAWLASAAIGVISDRADRLVSGDPRQDKLPGRVVRLATTRDVRARRHGALGGHAKRRVLGLPSAPRYGVRRVDPHPPVQDARVSIVTPTRDAPEHLQRFLDTVAHTRGVFDIILVDNGSTDKDALRLLDRAEADAGVAVIRDDRPFNFAALSNLGAQHATGAVIVFANNDLAFSDPDWLGHLVAPLSAASVGATGARLTYPDGRVQHSGIVLAGEARVRHAERFLRGDDPGHMGRQCETCEVAAVTGALIAVRAETFRAAGGFAAHRYPVLYNDVDLCLRLRARGLQCLFVGRSRAVHHESVTFGGPDPQTLLGRGSPHWRMMRAMEADRFRQDWVKVLDRDPCYPVVCDPLEAQFFARR